MPSNDLRINQPIEAAKRELREQSHPDPQYWLQAKFDELGGSAALGEPISREPEVWTLGGGSCICFNRSLFQAFEIHGDIYARWIQLGGLSFAAPTTDEWPTPDGIGRANHFSGGASIYWTPETGAHAVYGEIRKLWAERGWERSYLGYPTSDEVEFAEGGRASEFQHGGIYFWGDTGAIDLPDVVVHYTGLHCFGETDENSSSDEPYVILSATTPTAAATTRSRIYEGVDAGESCPDLIEIYRGRPYGINIGAVLMENDLGDPDKFKDEIDKAVMGVHSAGTLLLGLIPIVGPVVASIAGPALGELMPEISGAINDWLGTDDDRIGGSKTTLSAKQMVLLAARVGNSEFAGIGYKVETDLISGDGASYKIYFGLVPA